MEVRQEPTQELTPAEEAELKSILFSGYLLSEYDLSPAQKANVGAVRFRLQREIGASYEAFLGK